MQQTTAGNLVSEQRTTSQMAEVPSQTNDQNYQQSELNKTTTLRNIRSQGNFASYLGNHRNRQSKSRQTLKPQSGFSFMRACSPKHKTKGDFTDYEKIIKDLKAENEELKKEIIQLKVSQFYRFDQNKVKQLIAHSENLRLQNREYRRKLQEAEVVRDFLERSNQKLKEQCGHFIKSLMNLKMGYDTTYDGKSVIQHDTSQKQKLQHSYLMPQTPTKRRADPNHESDLSDFVPTSKSVLNPQKSSKKIIKNLPLQSINRPSKRNFQDEISHQGYSKTLPDQE